MSYYQPIHYNKRSRLLAGSFFCLALLCITETVRANTIDRPAGGILKGQLRDSLTNETLIGASVLLQGTKFGAVTDVEGNYTISGIPAGKYVIVISYIGYKTATIADVVITEGAVTILGYLLTTGGTELVGVEIIGDKALSGKVIETNELSLLNSIRSSSLIVTGISAQQISRSVDQDAGEVAKRLPGVSVLGNFINIRGMSERYNLTILNGMVAPSSEADRRAFSYDLLPSNMIDKMTVYRSPGPELLADWAGGVIKIETKNTSVAREIELNTTVSYRTNSTFQNYYSYKGGSKDWMGKDDGTRQLPTGFPAPGAIPAGGLTTFSSPGRGPLYLYTPEELAENAALGRSLYNAYDLSSKKVGLDLRSGINYYDSRLLGKMRISNLTAINTTQSTLVRYQDFNPLQDTKVKNGEIIIGKENISYKDTISQRVSRWGILQNLTFAFGPKHSIVLNGLFNQLGTDEVSVRDGVNSGSDADSKYLTSILYTYKSRRLFGAQISGSHKLGGEFSHSISWKAAYNSAIEEIPAQRNLIFRPTGAFADENAKRVLYSFGLKFNIDNNLFYTRTRENNSIFSLDYEKKFKYGFVFKTGIFNENKSKPLTSRLIRTGQPGYDTAVTRFNPEDAFKAQYYKDDGTGFFISDDDQVSGQYVADGRIYAGYAALNLPFFHEKVNLYGGVRYEGQALTLTIPPSRLLEIQGKNPRLIDKYTYYWLPSANLTINVTKKFAIRAAFGKTINRPNYRELIPLYVFDPRLENRRIGNDNLKDAQIYNADFRLEYYPSPTEFISVGAYYKKLIDAIEPYVRQDGNNEDIYYDNTKSAEVYGAELEVRKSFTFLPWDWGKNLSVIANFAVLKSEVQFQDSLIVDKTGDFRDFRTSQRPLEGTANFVGNAGVYFDIEKWGTKLSSIYNVIGQRLITAGSFQFPDTYEMPRGTLDLTLRQRLTKWMELRAGVQDVLNKPRKLYRDYDLDQQFDPTKRNKLPKNDWLYQQYKPGTYITMGINIKI